MWEQRTSEIMNNADIFDLTVELGAHSRKFSYKLYDKRDKFKFSIVKYPELGGNPKHSQGLWIWNS